MTIARLRFSAVSIADDVREFSGLTSVELRSLIEEDLRLDGRSPEALSHSTVLIFIFLIISFISIIVEKMLSEFRRIILSYGPGPEN